jgi:leader peptidase (prepilin peptidase) / N-methyltransferase
VQHAQEWMRGLVPLAFDVPSLYLSRMATLRSRGHLLGTRSNETGGTGAVRPDDAQLPAVGTAVPVRQTLGVDSARCVTRWRLDAMRAASLIHAKALEQSQRRSFASLWCADRLVVGDGTVLSMSTVPGRFGTAAYALAGVVAVLLPGVLNSFVSDVEASTALQMGVVVLAMIGALIVGVECVRKLLLGLRWRRTAHPAVELANVASWPGGRGAAGRLVDDTLQSVDAGTHIVVRVDRANVVALRLYRSRGFHEIDEIGTGSLMAMGRSAQPACTVSSRLVPSFVAGALSAAVFGLAQASAAGVGLSAVVGLGVGVATLVYGAVVDLRTLRIPNWSVVAALAAAAIAGAAHGQIRGLWLGAIVGAGPFLLMHVFDPRSLGFGDVKFAASAGAIVGVLWWPGALLSGLIALVLALVVRNIHPNPRPFAPCLLAGTVAALIAASWVIEQGANTS